MMVTRISRSGQAFRQAWLALMERKTQTYLSIAGVCVGVAAVIFLSMITESGRIKIFNEFETYGLTTIWVYRHWEQQAPDETRRSGSGISNENIKAFEHGCCPSVLRYSPNVYLEDWRRQLYAGNNFTQTPVQGVGVDFFVIDRNSFIEGRGFNIKDVSAKRKVAVIGLKTKQKLFGELQSALGKTIRVDGFSYKVIGVLQNKDRTILDALGATQGFDINDRFLVPYTTYQSVLGTKDIHTLLAEAKDQRSLTQAVSEIESTLLRLNNRRFQYRLDTMSQWIDTANEILNLVASVGVSAAMISLFVGGIGIFNVLSSSVTERTREIGIRKAVGAGNADILRQFLFEAGVIGVMGAMFGVLFSLLVGIVLYFIYDLILMPSWLYVFLAVFSAIGIAIFAAVKPANKAAKMKPAEALRIE
ncbi:MAG: ABC transporter permease [Gammaproteobacteria bacterium]|nr:ABC transporter permease [Gammaproteobacteria bacterium]